MWKSFWKSQGDGGIKIELKNNRCNVNEFNEIMICNESSF